MDRRSVRVGGDQTGERETANAEVLLAAEQRGQLVDLGPSGQHRAVVERYPGRGVSFALRGRVEDVGEARRHRPPFGRTRELSDAELEQWVIGDRSSGRDPAIEIAGSKECPQSQAQVGGFCW
jgi:hypothetical protein